MGQSNSVITNMITVSNTEQDVYTAIRTWLLTIVPAGWEIIQGQQNLVPMPIGQFILMTTSGSERLSTNIDKLDSLGSTTNIASQFKYKMQLDFYGDGSSEYSAAVVELLRDYDTPAQFPDWLKPLYGDELMQIPLITGGGNFLERWRLTAYFQFNPTISNSTQSANALKAKIVPVDIFYKA